MKSNRSGGDSVLKGGASIGFVILMSVALLGPGCAGGSSDAIQGILNTTGPRVTQVQYIDVDGNGVDENDLLVVTFEKAITISSTSAGAFGFDNILDSLGSAPTISQSIPRSDKVEILLGSGADLVPGASILDILSGGLINIEDLTGVDARAASVLVTVSDFTATAPTLLSTFYNDADLDGTMNVGDTLLCVFDKPVTIPVGQTVAGNFSVPVTGDSLGAGVSMTLFSEGPGNRGVLITLGTSPILTVNGTFDVGVVGAGSPSGIAMVALPGITDTLASGAQAVTGNTVVDLAPLGASFFRILQAGTLFPGNIDSTASDVSPNGFYAPQGVAHIDDTVTVNGTGYAVDLLFAADTSNNRVLIFDGRPSGNNGSASVVLGQADMLSNLPNRSDQSGAPPTANTLSGPVDVHFYSAGNQLFVSDTGNNRVLIFNDVIDGVSGLLSLQNGDPADVVLGQPSMLSGSANQGVVPTSRTLSGPTGIDVDGGQVGVADTGNHRVLLWSSVPAVNNASASTVLGQADFVSNQLNRGSGVLDGDELSSPEDVEIDATVSIDNNTGIVLVADTGNNRVIFWNGTNPSSGSAAARVIGQANLTTNAAGSGATQLDSPTGVLIDEDAVKEIFVADRDNHRVTVYTYISNAFTDGPVAAKILGGAGVPGSSTLNLPRRVVVSEASAPAHLFISDTGNHRILDFNVSLGTTANPAGVEQGQPSFSTSMPKGHTTNHPTAAAFTAGKMIVADRLNNRVLIYNSVPTAGDPAPDVVVGQASLYDTGENQGGGSVPAANTLRSPEGAATDGTRLVVADTGNHRVLIYNSIPAADDASADVVLGQSLFTTATANAGGVSAATMDSPVAVAVSGTRLLVCDRDNHRVLIFNDITAVASGASADIVIGQDDFSSRLPNHGDVPRAAYLHTPLDVAVSGTVLFIADSGNHRLLGFFNIPALNGANGDFAVGQADLVTGSAGLSSGRMDSPSALATDGTRLIVSDSGNHRLLVFDSVPMASDVSADVVIGQSNFSSALPNLGNSTPSEKTLWSPRKVFFNGCDLWVADMRNSRLVRFR